MSSMLMYNGSQSLVLFIQLCALEMCKIFAIACVQDRDVYQVYSIFLEGRCLLLSERFFILNSLGKIEGTVNISFVYLEK